MSRVRVKICGVTNRADAELAIALGADALGFNFFEGSKRCISLDREGEWMAALPPFVTRVAVLVNAPLEEAQRVAAHPAIDWVQLHGDEDERWCADFAQAPAPAMPHLLPGQPFIKALRLRDAATIARAHRFSTRHVLLDAQAGAAYGGTGTLIDLELAAEFARRQPELTLILAGGLTPGNVAGAVRTVRPFAVDVASGVELAGNPRRKDPERVRAFVEAVRGAVQ
ncbi:MAG: phosphoribosylanthranilate isomerase [Chthoniobacter sp.]|jgi:phosphoribosylanthranilate isomerase|nr:phosphoribosylanthranilate isomerase [Chthoniobacter sp.]